MSVTSARTSNHRDDCSALSTKKRKKYRSQLGAKCYVCGYAGNLEVAHIIPRRESGNRLVDVLHAWSDDLIAFTKDSPENFVLLCALHHEEYDSHQITLLPSTAALQAMIAKKEDNWARREKAVDAGADDPGRRLTPLKELPKGLQIIPVSVHFYIQTYNSCQHLDRTFQFDSWGVFARPEPAIQVPAYSLLVAAHKQLLTLRPVPADWAKEPRDLALKLIKLYERELSPKPVFTEAFKEEIKLLLADSKTWAPPAPGQSTMPTIPEVSHQDGGAAGNDMQEDVGGSSGSVTSDPSSGGISEGVQELGAGVADDNEPVVTPGVLSARLPWKPIKCDQPELGSMRFATSADFITAPNTTGTEDD